MPDPTTAEPSSPESPLRPPPTSHKTCVSRVEYEAALADLNAAYRCEKVVAERDAARAEAARLREALVELDDDCCYEIEERRCCSEQYPLPYSDWCVRCIAHGALADRSEHLPTGGAEPNE